jgi:hypothetical protein
MSDYTEAEQAEMLRIREEYALHSSATHPLADHYSSVAHFVMRKLREERGYDFKAAEARRLRARLSEIDRDVMLKD